MVFTRTAVAVLVGTVLALASVKGVQVQGGTGDQAAIQKVIWEFFDGAFNRGDSEAVTKNLHPDYLRFMNANGRVRAFSRLTFLESILVPKLLGTWQSENETVRFLDGAAVGNIGFAEVECVLNGQLHGTDYFFLSKFADGWKAVGSIDQGETPSLRAATDADRERERTAIRAVIQEAYVDGLQNWGSMDAVRKGIHPMFSYVSVRQDNTLGRTTRDGWIANVERSKTASPGGPKARTTVRFLDVKVLGNIGYARFELLRDGKPTFLDMMLLLRLGSGWQIVMKQGHFLG